EDVVCFPEYMEMWMHSARIEEFRVWLSRALNLASLDHLNLQLSVCGFSLQNDPDDNYVFRVSYTGCFNGFNVLTLNLVRRMNRFGSQHHSFTMKCPVMSVVQSREQIHCDPEYVQVIREIPYGNWDNELQWSLCLDDHLLVALEDASLIQMNIDVNVTDIRVQGRRREILRPVNEGEFLDLKLVRDRYAYSMEATCPKNASTADKTVLHILKRRMGLTRRGTYHNEALTLSDLSVIQTVTFTVHETSEFVTLSIPTAQILQTKLLQPFYRVDAVLTFRETNHKMHWTMESTLPCI
uniref:Si:ch211-129o18.4 n=1 Tax=Neolamprologus brichardi TaxID=32507 RepID=A0A3Q4GNT3_NEOBR